MELEEQSLKVRKRRVMWGLVWAILCAAFWGIGYVPLDIQWMVPPFNNNAGLTDNAYLICSIFMAATQAMIYTVIMFLIWAGLTGKFKETVRTIAHAKFDKSIIMGAVFGGPCAVFGTCLAVGYIGGSFASAMAMMSSLVGAFAGVVYYKEKATIKMAVGLALILIGGLFVLNPSQMIENITHPESPDGIILGYIGGILAAVGWGVEGVFLAKVLDIADADSVIPVRYTLEALIWVIIILPITCIWLGPDLFVNVASQVFTSVDFLAWEAIACFWMGFCYAFMYKAYPLIGVGRTMSFLSFNVVFTFIAEYIFIGHVTGWWIVVGGIIAIIGKLVMYWERTTVTDSARKLEE